MQIDTTFSILIALGAGLGLYQIYRLAPARLALSRLDAAVVTLLAGLVGARVFFLILNRGYYLERPLEAIQPGGLRWEGAVLGALLALPVLAIRSRTGLAELADNLAHLLPPLAVAAWLGCWQAGCGCAPAVDGHPFWAIPSPDESGLVSARFPLQPAAALLLALEFLLAHAWSASGKRPGLLASSFGLALGVNLLVFSLFGAESAPLWRGWRLASWGAAALALLSLAAVLVARKSSQTSRTLIERAVPTQE